MALRISQEPSNRISTIISRCLLDALAGGGDADSGGASGKQQVLRFAQDDNFYLAHRSFASLDDNFYLAHRSYASLDDNFHLVQMAIFWRSG